MFGVRFCILVLLVFLGRFENANPSVVHDKRCRRSRAGGSEQFSYGYLGLTETRLKKLIKKERKYIFFYLTFVVFSETLVNTTVLRNKYLIVIFYV